MDPYKRLTLGMSPLAYWRLGESSGTVAADETGNYPGTYVNSPTLGVAGALAGDPDGAVTFNRSLSQYMMPPSKGIAAGGAGAACAAAWVKIPAATGEPQRVVMYGTGGSYTYSLTLNATGHASFEIYNSAGADISTPISTAVVADGEWHHLVGVVDGSTASIYVDGALADTKAVGVGWTDSPFTRMWIGTQTLNRFVNGSIDEVAVWRRALSATEVKRLYQVGVGLMVYPTGALRHRRQSS